MIKIIVFDLDNTLAKVGCGITDKDLLLLKQIESKGVKVAICSGKPTYYLCGFMRQVGLDEPILIGENGAVIQFGVELPPSNYNVLPYSETAKKSISYLKLKFEEILPDLWYQPNQVGLTPFPSNDEEFEIISNCIEKSKPYIGDVTVYRHIDSFDIIPNGINKYAGLEYLAKLLEVDSSEMIAVGDGVNDYPMFEYAGLAVGVNVSEPSKVNVNFDTITDALEYILTMN